MSWASQLQSCSSESERPPPHETAKDARRCSTLATGRAWHGGALRILLIGGTGPTGPGILEGLLERGHTPVVLHRGTHEVTQTQAVEHIHADPHFTDSLREAMTGRTFDVVIATYGRLRLLPEVFDRMMPRIITVGGAIYLPSSVPSTEESPRWLRGKLYQRIVETERALARAHDAGRICWTHLRYTGLYGPRQIVPREWSIVRRLRDGRTRFVVPDAGLTIYSRAFTENAAGAVLSAFDAPAAAAGQVYNVADAVSLSIADRIRMVADIMDRAVDVIALPVGLGGPSAAHWLSGRSRRDHSQGSSVLDTQHEIVSTAKIRSQLGYTDAVEVREAMTSTVGWYLENPLSEGGELEDNLGDPFDYDAEDELVHRLRQVTEAASDHSKYHYSHAYDHPEPADE